jgi:hypothetical protein
MGEEKESKETHSRTAAPSITLPKGGGAIRGLDGAQSE